MHLKPYPTLSFQVATVLTVYGIETMHLKPYPTLSFQVATVLTVYGIETFLKSCCDKCV